MLKDTFALTMNLLKAVVKAAFELGKTIVEFTKSMVEFTYKTAARFVEAALEVGATVAEMLAAVAKSTYFVFRRSLTAFCKRLAPWATCSGGCLTRVRRSRPRSGARQCWRFDSLRRASQRFWIGQRLKPKTCSIA